MFQQDDFQCLSYIFSGPNVYPFFLCSELLILTSFCFLNHARLLDALEMMKQGVRRLLVPKSVVWRGMSKRFSILYNGKWLKNIDASSSSSNSLSANPNCPNPTSTMSSRDKSCCLSREDMIRFLIGCLGALAPLPLTSISSLGAINHNFNSIDASLPAFKATFKTLIDPSAIAVVETVQNCQLKIIGEISASRLWKCDYLATAWALANLSAGQFVMGIEDNSMTTSRSFDHFALNSSVAEDSMVKGAIRPKKFSSRSIGFYPTSPTTGFSPRTMYRGRSAPLTCRISSTLAAVMAQMLSHRATHVWVTEDDSDDVLVGVVGYADILAAVTKQPSAFISSNQSCEAFGNEIQN